MLAEAEYETIATQIDTSAGRLKVLHGAFEKAGGLPTGITDDEVKAIWSLIDSNREAHGLVPVDYVGLGGFIRGPMGSHLIKRSDLMGESQTELTPLGVSAVRAMYS